jgi:pyruvate dehydrogenase E2 component (dihydrolipoamide acetyltransferase)
MATEVKLPRLGQGMESGVIGKWLKSEGDPVEKGEPLYEVETDKATQEVEAEASGVLLKIAVAEGEVPVGQTVAVIGEAGEALPETATSGAVHGDETVTGDLQAAGTALAEPVPPPADADTAGGGHPDGSVTDAPPGGRIKASPLARRMARERGVELSALTGTGPEGRIVAEDVEAGPTAVAPTPAPAAAAPAAAPGPEPEPLEEPELVLPPPAETTSVPLTNVRRTIARRLTEAWEIPVFVLTVSVDMGPANALIERARELNPDERITVTDLLAKVCAQALQRHPDVNVQFTGEAILRFPSAAIGIAVAAPKGLVVPVIRSAERLSLAEISRRRAKIVSRARKNKLKQDDLDGGTFTISNLGMYGVEQFVAILNPPQAAILAVGTTEERAVVREGQIVSRPMMTVTLTVDHRAVDGAPAAEFLQTVKTFLEEPALAL